MNLTPPSDEELQEAIREFEEENIIFFPEILGLDKLRFARILVDAMAKFFGDFPAEGYQPLSTFTDRGIKIQNPSIITLMEDDKGQPLLNARVFRDDGSWMFNGYINTDRYLGYFLGISLQYLVSAKKSDELVTDEKFKENLVNTTYSVMCMAMRRMPKWIEIMLDSFENKIELIWGKQIYDEMKENNSLSGLDLPRVDLNVSRQKSIRAVEARIREFLQDDTGIDRQLLNLKKKGLAMVFGEIYSHWEFIQKLQLAGKNWRRYIQAGDMSDVTEDLIEDFVSDKQIGDIAIEHAARRAELHNIGNLTKGNQELRSRGIKCSGYSRSKLFEFKREGETIMKEEELESSSKTKWKD